MNARAIALATLAVMGLGMFAAGSAEARDRFHWRHWRVDPDFGFYRPGPAYLPYPYYDFEDEYYEDPPPRPRRYSYAPDYYEPEYMPPRRKRNPAYYVVRPEPVPAKQKPKLISCKKATGIVSEYGFEQIEATDCKGQTYAFKAVRDGKNFAITLNSVSGVLTRVKKL
jgi:hypothetical protein